MQSLGVRAQRLAWVERLGGSGSVGGGHGRGAAEVVVRRVSASAGRVAVREAGTRERLNGFRAQSSVTTEPSGRSFQSAEQKVLEVVAKQAAMVDEQQRRSGISLYDVRRDLTPGSAAELLDEAYVRCGEVCAEYAKTFYLGRLAFSPGARFHPRKPSRRRSYQARRSSLSDTATDFVPTLPRQGILWIRNRVFPRGMTDACTVSEFLP